MYPEVLNNPSLLCSLKPSFSEVWDCLLPSGGCGGCLAYNCTTSLAPEVDGQASDVPPSEMAIVLGTIQEDIKLSLVANQKTKDLLREQRCY